MAMKITVKRILKFCMPYGIIKIYRRYVACYVAGFYDEYRTFKAQKKASPHDHDFVLGKVWPFLADKHESSGSTKGDYFHQDLLVARRIYENNPATHIDIGSRIDGFVAHVASFRDITVLDIRPSADKSHHITFVQNDFMERLDDAWAESTDSVSSLNAMEHFGLGRYGDPLNYEGHLVGIENLHRILKRGGVLYFSVPIGTPARIEFHAHRVFSPKYLYDIFREKYSIDRFSYVDGAGDLHENVDITEFVKDYRDANGCGIWEMTKL